MLEHSLKGTLEENHPRPLEGTGDRNPHRLVDSLKGGRRPLEKPEAPAGRALTPLSDLGSTKGSLGSESVRRPGFSGFSKASHAGRGLGV